MCSFITNKILGSFISNPWQQKWLNSHLCEVEWAIKISNPYKISERDRIFPVLLKEGLSILLGPLTESIKD